MAQKKEKKQIPEKIEREYVIPIRRGWIHVPRYRKAKRAVKEIKSFLVRHMKIRDRDLNKVKVDKYLNEFIWSRGIKNPPSKVKVKAIKEGDIVRVELLSLSESMRYKKERMERIEKKAIDVVESKKTAMQRAKETMKGQSKEREPQTKTEVENKEKENLEKKDLDEEKEKSLKEVEEKIKKEKKKEEDEKKSALIESAQKSGKEIARKSKHETKFKGKQLKHQQRKALAK